MRPSVAVVTAAWCSAAAASMVPPDPSPVRRIRVCTYGGEGVCGQGGGAKTLAALRFLTPPDAGIEPSGCSCLARCDQGVAVQVGSGSVVGNVNGAREAAKLLKGLGVAAIDARLVSAFAAAARGEELMSDDRPTDALNAYNRAFGLATAAGLGMQWRSRPSSVLRVRQRMGGGRSAGTMGSGVSQQQVMWLADLMASRSRVFAALASQARPTPPPPSTLPTPVGRSLSVAYSPGSLHISLPARLIVTHTRPVSRARMRSRVYLGYISRRDGCEAASARSRTLSMPSSSPRHSLHSKRPSVISARARSMRPLRILRCAVATTTTTTISAAASIATTAPAPSPPQQHR